MTTKTSELTGTTLDWAVAKADGYDIVDGVCWSGEIPEFNLDCFNPSECWAQAGPIIEREQIAIECTRENLWQAEWWDGQHLSSCLLKTGETPLVAAMRCYVASKLGDKVDIPEELQE